MSSVEHVKKLWPKAKFLFLEYDGAATEILITNLRNDSLSECVNKIDVFLQKPEILTISSYGLKKPIPLTSESKKKLIADPTNCIQHSIRGSFIGERDICFYIWIDGPNKIFEIDVVFWNDVHFPDSNTEVQHIETFTKLVGLANRIKNNTPNSKCILTPEHNGPTEELYSRKQVVIW